MAGDFNQWVVDLADLADMSEVDVGDTRKDKCLDRVYTNIGRKVVASGTVDPLETKDEEGPKRSDHRIAYSVLSS